MNALSLHVRRPRYANAAPRILPMAADPPTRGRVSIRRNLVARQMAADLCYLALRLAGWLAVTVLTTLGLYVLFFMALGNMSAEGFFAQLANLGDRFVAADAIRRSSFVSLLATLSAALFLLVSAARLRSLLAIFSFSDPAGKDRP